MSKLHPDAAALVRAGRTAFRPDPADRDRVLRSLSGVLGSGGASDGARQAETGHSGSAARPPVSGWLVGGLVAVALGTGVFVAWHPWSRKPATKIDLRASSTVASPPATPAGVETVPPASPLSTDILPAVQQPPRVEAASSPTPRAATRGAGHSPDSLPEEVRLLSRAEQQMSEGLAGDALKTLTEHERRFPGGALAEERLAARVQALCMLGRTSEARSELTRLKHAYPRSPHLDRARRICGIEVDSNASP